MGQTFIVFAVWTSPVSVNDVQIVQMNLKLFQIFEQDQFEAGFFTEGRDSTQYPMKIGENTVD